MARGKKKNKLSNGLPLFINIAAFDTKPGIVRDIAVGVPLEEAKPIGYEDYLPEGGTPLNDAVVKFGSLLRERYEADPEALHVGLLADESYSMAHLRNDVIEGFNTFIQELQADEEPTTEPGVIMVIMTDGEENSSTEDRTGEAVSAWIKQREEDDGWNFFYLGANQDAWSTGAGLGLGAGSTSFNYAATSQGHRHAMGAVTTATKLRKTTDSNVYAGALASASPGVMTYEQPDVDTTPKVDTPKADPKYVSTASDIAKKVKTGS
jgi:hypothetical protein